ncbi:hypothetical protein TNCV_1287211 [Trichonephila clavipes]|nr:hypothetical protein TNCV_1287211 [Trichonephila clavipes]
MISNNISKIQELPAAASKWTQKLRRNKKAAHPVCNSLPPGEAISSSTRPNYGSSASPHMRWVEGKERWEAPDRSKGVIPQNCCGTKQNHTDTSMVLKAKENKLCRDEFRGYRSDVSVDQVA